MKRASSKKSRTWLLVRRVSLGRARRGKDKGGRAWHTMPVHELSKKDCEGQRGMGYQSLDEVKRVSTQGEVLWWWPGVG